MAKVFTYFVLFTGMIFLFTLAGLPTTASKLITYFGLTQNTFSLLLGLGVAVTMIGGAIATLALSASSGGIIMGTLGRGASAVTVFAAYVTPLTLVIMDAVFIVSNSAEKYFTGLIISAILIPLTAGYIIAISEWIKGAD